MSSKHRKTQATRIKVKAASRAVKLNPLSKRMRVLLVIRRTRMGKFCQHWTNFLASSALQLGYKHDAVVLGDIAPQLTLCVDAQLYPKAVFVIHQPDTVRIRCQRCVTGPVLQCRGNVWTVQTQIN